MEASLTNRLAKFTPKHSLQTKVESIFRYKRAFVFTPRFLSSTNSLLAKILNKYRYLNDSYDELSTTLFKRPAFIVNEAVKKRKERRERNELRTIEKVFNRVFNDTHLVKFKNVQKNLVESKGYELIEEILKVHPNVDSKIIEDVITKNITKLSTTDLNIIQKKILDEVETKVTLKEKEQQRVKTENILESVFKHKELFKIKRLEESVVKERATTIISEILKVNPKVKTEVISELITNNITNFQNSNIDVLKEKLITQYKNKLIEREKKKLKKEEVLQRVFKEKEIIRKRRLDETIVTTRASELLEIILKKEPNIETEVIEDLIINNITKLQLSNQKLLQKKLLETIERRSIVKKEKTIENKAEEIIKEVLKTKEISLRRLDESIIKKRSTELILEILNLNPDVSNEVIENIVTKNLTKLQFSEQSILKKKILTEFKKEIFESNKVTSKSKDIIEEILSHKDVIKQRRLNENEIYSKGIEIVQKILKVHPEVKTEVIKSILEENLTKLSFSDKTLLEEKILTTYREKIILNSRDELSVSTILNSINKTEEVLKIKEIEKESVKRKTLHLIQQILTVNPEVKKEVVEKIIVKNIDILKKEVSTKVLENIITSNREIILEKREVREQKEEILEKVLKSIDVIERRHLNIDVTKTRGAWLVDEILKVHPVIKEDIASEVITKNITKVNFSNEVLLKERILREYQHKLEIRKTKHIRKKVEKTLEKIYRDKSFVQMRLNKETIKKNSFALIENILKKEPSIKSEFLEEIVTQNLTKLQFSNQVELQEKLLKETKTHVKEQEVLKRVFKNKKLVELRRLDSATFEKRATTLVQEILKANPYIKSEIVEDIVNKNLTKISLTDKTIFQKVISRTKEEQKTFSQKAMTVYNKVIKTEELIQQKSIEKNLFKERIFEVINEILKTHPKVEEAILEELVTKNISKESFVNSKKLQQTIFNDYKKRTIHLNKTELHKKREEIFKRVFKEEKSLSTVKTKFIEEIKKENRVIDTILVEEIIKQNLTNFTLSNKNFLQRKIVTEYQKNIAIKENVKTSIRSEKIYKKLLNSKEYTKINTINKEILETKSYELIEEILKSNPTLKNQEVIEKVTKSLFQVNKKVIHKTKQSLSIDKLQKRVTTLKKDIKKETIRREEFDPIKIEELSSKQAYGDVKTSTLSPKLIKKSSKEEFLKPLNIQRIDLEGAEELTLYQQGNTGESFLTSSVGMNYLTSKRVKEQFSEKLEERVDTVLESKFGDDISREKIEDDKSKEFLVKYEDRIDDLAMRIFNDLKDEISIEFKRL